VIRLDAATVMLQWATGGLAFLWVTTRGRLVGLGYGWLMRTVFALIALLGVMLGLRADWVPSRDIPAIAMIFATCIALVVSIQRKSAGVREQRLAQEAKRSRVAAMTGAQSNASRASESRASESRASESRASETHSDTREPESAAMHMRDQFGRLEADVEQQYEDVPEFPPTLDLVAPLCGLIGVVAAAVVAAEGGASTTALAIARFVVGALFLGAVSDAMLLGHWYLVQPGLSRRPIHELNDWVLRLWPVEVILLLIPTGMVQALTGTVSDGWSGTLTWFWFACAAATGILSFVTRIALKERYYSAVMAATGFLYLAILMAFCTDVVGRAILAP
jgi:hypothetical protein